VGKLLRLNDGWWGTVPPVMLMALPLDIISLRVTVCFLGTIGVVGEIFFRKVWVFREKILSAGAQISM